MRNHLRVLFASLLCAGAASAQPPECRIHFTVVRHDGNLLAFDQMSESQQKWWNGKGSKKYKAACIADPADPEYLIVWGKEIESKSGLAFVYHPGTTSTSTVHMDSGDTGSVTTTTPGTSEAVPTVRTTSRVHVYVFAWRNGKLEGPLWMNDRTGEAWGERAWGQVHPASQQLFEDALKYLSAKR
jgi:hypothetical protein